MTLTRESEALLRNLRVWTTVSPHWEGPEDEVWSYVALDLTRLEAAVRAEQAAEVERLQAALEDCSALLPRLRSYILSGEPVNALDEADILGALMAARAALAPVAPAPAEPRP